MIYCSPERERNEENSFFAFVKDKNWMRGSRGYEYLLSVRDSEELGLCKVSLNEVAILGAPNATRFAHFVFTPFRYTFNHIYLSHPT